MGFEIASVKNTELRAAALLIDNDSNIDGVIDGEELNIFNEKANALLKDGKCTERDLSILYAEGMDSVADIFKKTNPVEQDADLVKRRAELNKKMKEAKSKYDELDRERSKLKYKKVRIENILKKDKITEDDYWNNITTMSKIEQNGRFTEQSNIVSVASLVCLVGAGLGILGDNLKRGKILEGVSLGMLGLGLTAIVAMAADTVNEVFKGIFKDTSLVQNNFRKELKNEAQDCTKKELELEQKIAKLEKEIDEIKQELN